MLKLKDYQNRALKALDAFLLQARMAGPKSAYETLAPAQGLAGAPYRGDEFGETPCICLRLPTGGGKTLLASHAITRIARNWLGTDAPVALWLTPSDAIRTQTLGALRAPGHPYREALEAAYGMAVRVCTLDEVANIAPADWGRTAIVIVATIQSFRISKTADRNVYSMAEDFEPHFKPVPPSRLTGLDVVTAEDVAANPDVLLPANVGQVKYSLVNWLALQTPIIIVDEAHNTQTDLSFRALKSLKPSLILELTATPLPKKANVLFHVSAQELQAEDMIKLPIVLAEHPAGWQSAVADAVLRQKALEAEAQHEADYIRPVVLFQAQPKGDEATVDVLRAHLIEAEKVPADQIAVATGSQRELDGINLMDPACPIRFVITVEALKEGWDCPFAYVLCSLQSVRSARDVEQLLGRVLRMPYAKRRSRPALNRAYALVVEQTFSAAANALVDKMVEKMGFEALEVPALLAPDQNDLFNPGETPTQPRPVVLPDLMLELAESPALPADTKIEIRPIDTGGHAVTFNGHVTPEIAEVLVASAGNAKQKEAVKERIERHNGIVAALLSPSARGVPFAPLPMLVLRVDGELELIEKELITALAGFDPLTVKAALPGFHLVESANAFEIYVDSAKVMARTVEGTQTVLNEVPVNWNETDLVNWLDQTLRYPHLTQAQTRKFLVTLIAHLMHERGITLAGLGRSRFQLVRALEVRLDQLREQTTKTGFRQLVFEGAENVEASFAFSFRFEPNRYPARQPIYNGRWHFNRHYYPTFDRLKAEGEEFECAKALDGCLAVKHWVRNIDSNPEFGFWLPVGGGHFYPDFVAELNDGRLLVVEYKGAHLANDPDELNKKQIGDLWAKKSNGKCVFAWVLLKDSGGRGMAAQNNAAIGV